MIGRLSGILLEKNPPQLIVDCNGVGYEVDVPMSTFYNLPALGEPVALLTHMVVREDAQLLYGFGSAAERDVFRQLIKVAGVGARTALSILSGLSVADLAQAITLQEAGRLTRVPGIGKKTAERLLLELKGKLGADLGVAGGAAGAGCRCRHPERAAGAWIFRQGGAAGAEAGAEGGWRFRWHQAGVEGVVEGVRRWLSMLLR